MEIDSRANPANVLISEAHTQKAEKLIDKYFLPETLEEDAVTTTKEHLERMISTAECTLVCADYGEQTIVNVEFFEENESKLLVLWATKTEEGVSNSIDVINSSELEEYIDFFAPKEEK